MLKLHTNFNDIELEISSLTKREIATIAKMKAINEILKDTYENRTIDLYDVFTTPFLRGKFSENRKSRGELIQASKSLNGESNDNIDNDSKYNNGRLRSFFSRNR